MDGGAGRCRLSVGFGRLVRLVGGLGVIMLGMSRQQVGVGTFFLSITLVIVGSFVDMGMGVLLASIHVGRVVEALFNILGEVVVVYKFILVWGVVGCVPNSAASGCLYLRLGN